MLRRFAKRDAQRGVGARHHDARAGARALQPEARRRRPAALGRRSVSCGWRAAPVVRADRARHAAFGALRRCRPLVHPNAGFLRQLRELATLLAAIDAADDGDANDRRVLHALRQRRARPAMLPNGQLALYDESASTVGSGGGGTDDFVDDNNDDDEASKNDFTCTLQ